MSEFVRNYAPRKHEVYRRQTPEGAVEQPAAQVWHVRKPDDSVGCDDEVDEIDRSVDILRNGVIVERGGISDILSLRIACGGLFLSVSSREEPQLSETCSKQIRVTRTHLVDVSCR